MVSPLRLLAFAVIVVAGFCQNALAQPNQPGDAPVARANAGTVGVISGGIDGTYVRIAADLAAADAPGATLERRIASVVPTPAEEKFLTVPWRTNVMAARDEAQRAGRPLFLWIMVGNPQGCT